MTEIDVAFNSSKTGKRVVLRSLERSRLSSSCLPAEVFAAPLALPPSFYADSSALDFQHFVVVQNALSLEDLNEMKKYLIQPNFQKQLISAQYAMGLEKSIRKTTLTSFARTEKESKKNHLPYFPANLRQKLTNIALSIDQVSSGWETRLPNDKSNVDQERIEMWYNEYHVGDHYKGWYDVYNSCCCCCCCCCWAYLDMKLTLID
jgi:hypothetical protein